MTGYLNALVEQVNNIPYVSGMKNFGLTSEEISFHNAWKSGSSDSMSGLGDYDVAKAYFNDIDIKIKDYYQNRLV